MSESGGLRLLPRPRRLQLQGATRVAERGATRYAVDRSLPPQGYRITIDNSGTPSVESNDAPGRFYAEATLAQMRRTPGDGTLPVGVVEDWPDLPVRAVMVDVARTKVPTLDTLFALVDRLASWKCNQLQLYMEHTFAYLGHEEVWRGADPYTADDLARLSAHCAARHVALVANQNTLGHMERWLIHPRYRDLGVASGVVKGPMGIPMPASTLDPANPGSLALVRQILGQLSEVLPGRLLHIGLDEPWDLPDERADEWGQWLTRLRHLPETHGRELLVWGDMVTSHPELLSVVGEGTTVCEWGYEADHPFTARLEALAAAGVPRWSCPGTSSWLSVIGRTTNAVDNCRSAARAAVELGGGGLLVTDWGDMGHLQHLPVSDPGLAAACAMSWCASTNGDLDAGRLAPLLDVNCYGDDAGELGAALVSLGDAHLLQPLQLPNISALVLHLYFPQMPVGPAMGVDLGEAHLQAVETCIVDARRSLSRARPSNEHGRLAVDELSASADLVLLCCADARARLAGDGTLASVPGTVRTGLADRLGELIAVHRTRWQARNRPGGLDESCAWLEHLRHCYVEGGADDDWAGPLVAAIRAGRAA